MYVKLLELIGFVESILDLVTGEALDRLPVHALVNPHQLDGGGLVPQVVILDLVVLQDILNVPFESNLRGI